MTGKMVLLPLATLFLAGASNPPTLAPPVTGSMYNGNNAHPPILARSTQDQSSTPAIQGSNQGKNSTTGQHIHSGNMSSEGGAG